VYVPYQRDPLSIRFDDRAVRLVARAYRVKGSWAGDFIPPPGPRALAWMAWMGIQPWERDRWGELRFIRAYKRACFWQLNNYGGVSELRGSLNTGAGSGGWHSPVRGEWQTGVRARQGEHVGEWAVRFRIHAGGAKTSRIGLATAQRLGDNWIDADGHATFRQSLPDDRDY
jgi:hypothetical protein